MAKIHLKSARTTEANPVRAAEALCNEIGEAPKLATLFISCHREARPLVQAVRERLPKGTRLIGASTAGEIDNKGMHNGGVLLGSLTGDFEVGLGVGNGLSEDAVAAGSKALAAAADDLGVRPQDLDTKKCVGLVIDDGLRYKKEELLLGVLDKCPALTLVGGGAAHEDFSKFGEVYLDGEVATDAVLVSVFKTDAPWGALRSHWYVPTGEMVRITKVDETCTRALEIDGKPAAQRYADLIGCEIDDLEFGKPKGFLQKPTAMRVGREHFIRAPWKPLPDGSIMFANLLDEGAELELMQLGDIGALSRRFFEEELPKRVSNPSACLLFHCSGRAWGAAALGATEELSATFTKAPPSAGFNVFFEIYSGFQINTTLTVLAFGESDV